MPGSKMDNRPLLCFVVGARPNFVKAAPVVRAVLESGEFRVLTVHTGQHYDTELSDLFFRDLEIPEPDLLLEVGSGSHAVQTAEVMRRIEPILIRHAPRCLVVFGDINSTVAAALTAVKLDITVAHVESGLRSFDRSMPEEINRIVTDSISDILLVTEESGRTNLLREGVAEERIHFVGNTMIDSQRSCLERARRLAHGLFTAHGIEQAGYGVLTLHRPSNVDDLAVLSAILGAITELARDLPILFPVHPRTRSRIEDSRQLSEELQRAPGLKLLSPVGYLDFLALIDGARLVLTDSGGIQEETTALGVACLTLRENTERPVTLEQGTNRLIGTDPRVIVKAAHEELERRMPRDRSQRPELWDGRAAERIVAVLRRALATNG
jgi:UDP-N-acetylglucosamine 2-epimerase (non-hydrolysing)